jgi:MoaA/NifB/PqqE/SkfB family radical SAM enzyme
MLTCFYALGGINYKNGVITTCPRQANQLVFAHETILPSEIFNHKNFRELRKTLNNDLWPSGCDTCEDMEKIGAKSMRKDYIVNADNFFCKPQKNINSSELYGKLREERTKTKLLDCYDPISHTVTNDGLRHIEFRFSTACNFSCLHCSKVYSSGWTKKLQNYSPDEDVVRNDLRQLLGTEHRHGPNDKNEMSLTTKDALKIVEDLNENFPLLQYVDFAGGELLYQKQFFPTLKKLAEHPNRKNISISFHTNFNADFSVDELSQVLEPFYSSAILISVDAGKSFYSYFRHGGKWDKLKSNIQEFKKINDFSHVDISCTTSIYQMLDIYDVFESFIELDCWFDASIVQTPKYLDPSLILLEYKKETYKDIEKTYELLQKNKKTRSNNYQQKDGLKAKYWLDYIVNYVKNFKPAYKDFNRFLIYRQKSDDIWEQNFNDYFQNYQIEDNELVRVK